MSAQVTPPRIESWLETGPPGEITPLVALRAAVAHADGTRVPRALWMESVRSRLAQTTARLGTQGITMLQGGGGEMEALVTTRALPQLAQIGVRPSPDDPSGSLVLDEGIAEAIAIDRSGLLDVLDRELERMESARSERFASPSAPLVPGSSRFEGRGLTKTYQRRKVVDRVDIEVSQSEIVGLLGPNGAGKTTTFYMLVGLIPPDAGKVLLDGQDMSRTPMYQRARKGVGYLAQEPSIFRKLSVEENVLAILQTLGLSRKEERARLEELLGELGLTGLRKSKAYALSGGERRRLEITRALVQRPKFMLLDEPFAGIDPIAVNDIQQIVRGVRERGIGVIISDHNVEQTLDIVDRAYIMYEGRIRVSGSVSELVWNDEVAQIYLGPTLTARMRSRYAPPPATEGA